MSEKKNSEKPAESAAPAKKKKRKLSDKQKTGLKELVALKSGEQAARLKEMRGTTRKNKTAIKKALAEKPLTVPEIAEKTSIEARQVLWIMTSLRKYGEVNEAGIDGDYPRYELVKS